MTGLLPLAADTGHHAMEIRTGDFLPWVILFVPLAVAAAVLVFPGLRRRGKLAGDLAIAGVAVCFGITFFAYFLPSLGPNGMKATEGILAWVDSGDLHLGFGTRMDELALTMTLVVTGVGLAIFIYALGYMHGDESMGRFYGKFSLFVFSMLGIVLSPNFFQTFVFWELVGASSYFLIGYYWKKDSAGEAAKKAFMTNRVGDFGFLLGILTVWAAAGHAFGVYTVDFAELYQRVGLHPGQVLFGGVGAVAAIAGFLIFMGAMGKSAQFPLHVWLPDAMEGPTPVSALMHAATMVAAGIYMIARSFFLFEDTGWAPTAVAWIGAITAFMAATIAVTQRDIKKILAYSTLSQLGYMTMALGAGAYTAAMFHLTTHAFFKALLFLCAGSVIHGCHHEQDIFEMGGIRKMMPSTWRTWLLGTLALCGIFPMAGFWSKDEILGAMHGAGRVDGHVFLYWVGVLTAGLTAFYMGRATILTFFGKYRGHAKVHESPKVMTLPLWALAIFAIFIGFIGLPGQGNRFEHFLHAWHVGDPAAFHLDVALISTLFAVGGLVLAWVIYRRAEPGTDPLPKALGPVWTLWNKLYYVDDFYTFLVKKVQQGIAGVCWLWERWVIIGTGVNGTGFLTKWVGDRLRWVQDGRLSGYVTAFSVGVVVLVIAAVAGLRWLVN
jgi:NADH-quinone oxidoreductase subunit L